jgi:hypothetical protein
MYRFMSIGTTVIELRLFKKMKAGGKEEKMDKKFGYIKWYPISMKY